MDHEGQRLSQPDRRRQRHHVDQANDDAKGDVFADVPRSFEVDKGLTVPTTCAAVFDNPSAAEQFVKRVKEENFGMSVNISTSIEGAERCCNYACLDRHSIGYSLGFEGKTEKIPNSQVTTLSTMCGHGMISHSLAKKMIDFVKENRRSPEQAATYLSRFCSCGIFNPARAKRILEDARTNSK
jgi:hypothetical protein